jgi:hypothetical protein
MELIELAQVRAQRKALVNKELSDSIKCWEILDLTQLMEVSQGLSFMELVRGFDSHIQNPLITPGTGVV